jgi:hypothetical protein
MKLTTILAALLALAASPAGAQEELPPPTLQKMQFERVVPSGKTQRVGGFHSLYPDCSDFGFADLRVIKKPEHGTAKIEKTSLFPDYPKSNERHVCNGKKAPAAAIIYKSAARYVGEDTFVVLIFIHGGIAREITYIIDVR